MIPVIRPNVGARKNPEKIEKIWNDFSPVAHIYKERYKIERCFAWEDTYRKLVIRYEKLQCTFMGFRYLAYSMIISVMFSNNYGCYSIPVHTNIFYHKLKNLSRLSWSYIANNGVFCYNQSVVNNI
ncbi:MAG: hypothetical protein WC906_00070 [Parcubacteria group bacterium]|jgi:hypothetical protein